MTAASAGIFLNAVTHSLGYLTHDSIAYLRQAAWLPSVPQSILEEGRDVFVDESGVVREYTRPEPFTP